MTTTLTRNPLRTSLSMTSGHDFSQPLPADHDRQPFGYLFANWEPGTPAETETELGYYDADQQVWVTPDGAITAGVYTKTRTSGSNCGDCVTDDACA
ncbi:MULTISPECIES: hypothetical protein [unclassified Micromonospora]|uniref:hypothetical protein n=1 Tax=unclassified Micromonospora TaxID=2617518 RepID=UPI002E0EA894|nr:hypothetical protein OIE53_28265 [Micromonospora sp. NBC_01739]